MKRMMLLVGFIVGIFNIVSYKNEMFLKSIDNGAYISKVIVDSNMRSNFKNEIDKNKMYYQRKKHHDKMVLLKQVRKDERLLDFCEKMSKRLVNVNLLPQTTLVELIRKKLVVLLEQQIRFLRKTIKLKYSLINNGHLYLLY